MQVCTKWYKYHFYEFEFGVLASGITSISRKTSFFALSFIHSCIQEMHILISCINSFVYGSDKIHSSGACVWYIIIVSVFCVLSKFLSNRGVWMIYGSFFGARRFLKPLICFNNCEFSSSLSICGSHSLNRFGI